MAQFAARSITKRGTNVGNIRAQMKKVENNLRLILKKIEEAGEQITIEVAEEILENALPRTPILTGDLRESGRVTSRQSVKGGQTASVTFGGVAAPTRGGVVDYAIIVHEDMEMPRKEGGPKYLELAALEVLSSGLGKKVADKYKAGK